MKQRISTRMLAVLALLTAVSIILSRLLGFYLAPSLRVSFEYFPIILAGVLFGPVAGGIVGGLADFLGSTVLSGLGFFPPLILGPILAGVVAGLIARFVFEGKCDRWWKILVVSCVADIVGNLLWGTFALSLLYHSPYGAFLILRTPLKLGIMVVDAWLVFAVSRALAPVLRGWTPKKRAA